MIPVIIHSVLGKLELIAAVCLAVSIEEFCTAVCMVVPLKYDIDIILIEYRGKLCSQDHTVCVGVIEAGTVDVLMNGDDTPFRIRISGYSFLDRLRMLGDIVIICVQYDEESVAVGVVVVSARFCLTVFRSIRIIEMIGIVRIQRIVVSDGGGYRKAGKSVRA